MEKKNKWSCANCKHGSTKPPINHASCGPDYLWCRDKQEDDYGCYQEAALVKADYFCWSHRPKDKKLLRWHFSTQKAKDSAKEARLKTLKEVLEIVKAVEELEGDPPEIVLEAMIEAGPVENARAACAATKQEIVKKIQALIDGEMS